MGRLSCQVRGVRTVLALALLATMVAAPAAALADGRGGNDGWSIGGDRGGGGGGGGGECKGRDDDRDEHGGMPHCPGRETLVSLDEKTCPPNPHRPLIVRQRACCKNPAGRVHCDHFPHCPNESPS